MSKEWATILIGLAIGIAGLVLQFVIKAIPTLIAITLLGVALILVVTGIMLMKKRSKYSEPSSSQNISDSSAGGDIYQAGRDITVNPSHIETQPDISWDKRAGGPQFQLHPSLDAQSRLLCEFDISRSSPAPGGVEARWFGSGTEVNWVTPMPQNVRRGSFVQSYQMKPVKMSPAPPEDEIAFEVRFNLTDGPHGGRWVWPMRQNEGGRWVLDSHKGSGVFQPKLEDTW